MPAFPSADSENARWGLKVAIRTLTSIRLGGHLPKGEYDGHDGGHQGQADAAQLHGRLQDGAVRLVLDEGKTVGAAARDLGLTEPSLRNRVEQARADRTQGRTGLTTEERAELATLRKDNLELRMEREILQNAVAAFFANDQA